ncbi:MAG TPA: gliding motility-associated C-terminal domain-containing protein, partial [Bacteroidales bacterium]|nr:gliding motility-associated C-terminal domain-containing protein [Bacteroidales bacterium]
KNAQVTESSFNPDQYLVKDDALAKPWVYTIKGTYYVKAQSGDICESNPTEMTYTVYPRARKPIVAETTICKGNEIEPIRAYGSPQIEWRPQHPSLLNKNDFGQEYNFAKLGITDLDTGLYVFNLVDKTVLKNVSDIDSAGCYSGETSATLRVAPAAETEIIGDSTMCEYTAEELYVLAHSPEKPSQYRWEVTGDNLDYTKDASSTAVRYIDWAKAGIDTIKVYERTFYGCDGYDELIVNIAEYPKAKYTWSLPGASNVVWFKDSTIQKDIIETTIDDETITIPISYSMYWNFDQELYEGYDRIVDFEQRNDYVEAGGYTYGKKNPELTVINEYGCESTYKQEIFIDIRSGIYMPTAFSPTNPAYSVRFFHPIGYNLEKCEIWVYDNWGNLIWYSDEVENGIFVGKWDGTYNGELMKSDTYIWKMEAKLLDGKQWEGLQLTNGKYVKFGSVTLIR